MTRLFLLLVAATFTITSVSASAQGLHSQHRYGHSYGHGYWHHPVHVPSVAQLDVFAVQLAEIAQHLHEDAHNLSQDYEHSASIEHYVDALERLQHHMHDILHDATESGTQSTALISHVKSDVREVRSLLNRLGAELRHQGFDGARTEDFRLMAHMRHIIFGEAFPLIRQMENELYGYRSHAHLGHTYSRSTGTRGWSFGIR